MSPEEKSVDRPYPAFGHVKANRFRCLGDSIAIAGYVH